LTGERILLIEDSDELRPFLAGTILTGAGFDVMSAANGPEGLVLARDLRPDLIIADQQMPGMSGLEVLDALSHEQIAPAVYSDHGGRVGDAGRTSIARRRQRLPDQAVHPDELVDAIKRTLARYWTRQIAERVPVQLYEANLLLEGGCANWIHWSRSVCV